MTAKKKKPAYIAPTLESESIESLSMKLLIANKSLAESEQKRKEMLANISHDLRSPLTAIRSSLDLLQSYEEIPQEEIKNAIGVIDRRVATLENLVQDMYFLFCVEDEKNTFDLETVDVAPFLESFFYDTIIDSKYDNHEMILDVPADLDAKITIDVQKTIRVFDNLLGNSAKYSGDGSEITLGAKLDDKIGKVIITVSDNGIGIPAEALPHIFDRTYTVSSARTPGSTAGSGLGLSIVSTVLAKENASIKCESELNKYCRFIIEFPFLDD